MEKTNRFTELLLHLQDPHLVSRFQRICGVRGTFSRTVSAGGGSSKEAERTHPHNGACYHQLTGESESKKMAVIGGGDNIHSTAAGVQRRTGDSIVPSKHEEESENAPRNGALTAGGETVNAAGNGRSGTRSDLSGGAQRLDRETGDEVPAPTQTSTLKPLRKNSLTGEAGQEFLIENRFLYYMFTFGTELGNELFYITFFPFVMWNVDAFVSRRLIMVWVWVMYLGQCTKDVMGWSRPASPPVVKVEMFYNSEYSMPSTHAMSGTAIPFALFFMTYGRWEVK